MKIDNISNLQKLTFFAYYDLHKDKIGKGRGDGNLSWTMTVKK